MYFNEILKQVSKPSRYIPIEKNPYKKEDDLYKIALVNAGNYESSITSLFFQSLYALVIDSKKYTPFRFFKPDNDYLSLVIEEKKYPHLPWHHVVLYCDDPQFNTTSECDL